MLLHLTTTLQADVEGVLFFDCPEKVMEERLINRGKTSGRSDDNAEVIKKRFHTYLKETMPVIDFFAAQGKVFKVVADKPVAAVYADTQKLVEPLIGKEVLAHNQAVLDSVHAGNWETYATLCAADMTAIEGAFEGVGRRSNMDSLSLSMQAG